MPCWSPPALRVVVLVGSRAPWWATSLAAMAAVAIAGDPVLIAVAGGALLLCVVAHALGTDRARSRGSRGRRDIQRPHARRAPPVPRPVRDRRPGVRRRGVRHRHPRVADASTTVRMGSGRTAALLAVVAGAAIGYEVFRVRHELSSGLRSAELGVAALEHDDFDEATGWFRDAADHLAMANDHLDRPWTRLASRRARARPEPRRRRHDERRRSQGRRGGSRRTRCDRCRRPARCRRPHRRRCAPPRCSRRCRACRDALAELLTTTDDARSPWLLGRASESSTTSTRPSPSTSRRSTTPDGCSISRRHARREWDAPLPSVVHLAGRVARSRGLHRRLRRTDRGRRPSVTRPYRLEPATSTPRPWPPARGSADPTASCASTAGSATTDPTARSATPRCATSR